YCLDGVVIVVAGALCDHQDAVRVENLAVTDQNRLVNPLVGVVVKPAIHRQLQVRVEGVVRQAAEHRDDVAFLRLVDRRDDVVLNKDDLAAAKPLLRRVSDAVVNTRDRLAVLVGHAIDITLERTGSHDEAAARTVGQRNLSEYLPLPRLPGADLLLAEFDDLIGRGSGFADYA